MKKEQQIFVIIPFKSKYSNVLEFAIKPAIIDAGFEVTIADGTRGGKETIHQDISDKIYNAEICIADISKKYDGKKLINRDNVIYEIGLAHAINRHVILICENAKKDLPYDMQHKRAIEYNSDDLKALKEKLQEEITIRINNDKKDIFFPQLQFKNEEDIEELERLRNNAVKLKINVYPPTADIFINDVLPKTLKENGFVYVNPNKRNTISVAAPAHYEEHREIEKEEYNEKVINIRLEKVPNPKKQNSDEEKKNLQNKNYVRIHKWLVNRKKDPQNPVLMRAVAQFFSRLADKVYDEDEKKLYLNNVESELKELLETAPGWYMAHNQMGVFKKENFKECVKHYKIAILLNPDSYLGYFNMACAYAREKNYEKTLEYIEKILSCDKRLESYAYTNMNLKGDKTFLDIKNDKDYGEKFNQLVDEIDSRAKEYLK